MVLARHNHDRSCIADERAITPVGLAHSLRLMDVLSRARFLAIAELDLDVVAQLNLVERNLFRLRAITGGLCIPAPARRPIRALEAKNPQIRYLRSPIARRAGEI